MPTEQERGQQMLRVLEAEYDRKLTESVREMSLAQIDRISREIERLVQVIPASELTEIQDLRVDEIAVAEARVFNFQRPTGQEIRGTQQQLDNLATITGATLDSVWAPQDLYGAYTRQALDAQQQQIQNASYQRMMEMQNISRFPMVQVPYHEARITGPSATTAAPVPEELRSMWEHLLDEDWI